MFYDECVFACVFVRLCCSVLLCVCTLFVFKMCVWFCVCLIVTCYCYVLCLCLFACVLCCVVVCR